MVNRLETLMLPEGFMPKLAVDEIFIEISIDEFSYETVAVGSLVKESGILLARFEMPLLDDDAAGKRAVAETVVDVTVGIFIGLLTVEAFIVLEESLKIMVVVESSVKEPGSSVDGSMMLMSLEERLIELDVYKALTELKTLELS